MVEGVIEGGTIKPGDSLASTPYVVNTGNMNASAFLSITVPVYTDAGGSTSPAYDWETGDGCPLIDETLSDSGAKVYVYAYGTENELMVPLPDEHTDPLTSGFTMKSDMTGSQSNGMSDINISFDG